MAPLATGLRTPGESPGDPNHEHLPGRRCSLYHLEIHAARVPRMAGPLEWGSTCRRQGRSRTHQHFAGIRGRGAAVPMHRITEVPALPGVVPGKSRPPQGRR